jgi:hypothetical protein
MISVLTPFLVQLAWQGTSPTAPPDILEGTLQQLAWQSPLLLVYVVGLVLSLVFLKRCPTASICAMIGLILLLVTGVGFSLLQNYFFAARLSQHWNTDEANRMMAASNLAATVVRAAAFSLILIAIFVGRRPVGAPKGSDYRTTRIG